jgi:2-haloacid dehalogenase
MQTNDGLQVLAFDVFGTVVDWHGSVVAEALKLQPDVDAAAFARAWRRGYRPAINQVMLRPYQRKTLDALHREILAQVAPEFFGSALPEQALDALNGVWHRLNPWEDAVAGIARLRQKYRVCTLSNADLPMLVNMARWCGIEWDCVFSAAQFNAYKPDPRVYAGVPELFGLAPEQVALVATHASDLEGARRCGLKTIYIERPLEFGADFEKAEPRNAADFLHCTSIADLADQLNCL